MTLAGGDRGQLPNPYYYIWKKKVTDVHSPVDVKIPSTVIYEHDFPKAWYYYSKSKEETERRVGKEIDTASIVAEFTKKASGAAARDTDIVAYWLTQSGGRGSVAAEFFDKEGLKDFLTKRKKRGHGILQKFVAPSGTNNATIQAIWTPYVVLVEKRQNTLSLDDTRQDMASRCVTYEGPVHISRPSFVAPHIEWKVREVCRQLTAHMGNLEQGISLSQMTLYFRVSKDGDLWLLWCSELQTDGKDGLRDEPSEKANSGAQADTSSGVAKDLRKNVEDDLKLFDSTKEVSMGPIGDTYYQSVRRMPRRRRPQADESLGGSQKSPQPPTYNSDSIRSKMGLYSRVPPGKKDVLLDSGAVQQKLNKMARESTVDCPIWLKGDDSSTQEEAGSRASPPRNKHARTREDNLRKSQQMGSLPQGHIPAPPKRRPSCDAARPKQPEYSFMVADLLKKLHDFADHEGYNSYSHFLCSSSGYMFSMPPELDAQVGAKFAKDFYDAGVRPGSVAGEYIWRKPKGLMSAIPHRFETWASEAERHIINTAQASDTPQLEGIRSADGMSASGQATDLNLGIPPPMTAETTEPVA
uniref:Uncharacterized protein n=2 Tax=Eutreptiella gymnastica TaxID=73025 RepID=A0A7S1HZ55_9EUGL|mmetsp:Transcript_116428/g.202487  ORF Transcript_116428/g.202487 Transcript_116428/m.202487 type:complete len:582 (+) Transcript_116428:87-1832(+)